MVVVGVMGLLVVATGGGNWPRKWSGDAEKLSRTHTRIAGAGCTS